MTDILTSGGVAGTSDDLVLSAVGRRRLIVPGMATLRQWGQDWNGTGPYDIDARVRWKGLAWVSVAAANVSEPGTDANWIEFT